MGDPVAVVEEIMETKPIAVGTILHGFCGGWFGRESYGCKRVEALGADWIVAREVKGGQVVFASDEKDKKVLLWLEEWTAPVFYGDGTLLCCDQ